MFDSVQLLGFGLLCSLTLIHSLYVISIRQTGVLLPSSFRFHLAMDTLDFSYILPTVGRIWDFHPLETCAAGRTQKLRETILISLSFSLFFCVFLDIIYYVCMFVFGSILYCTCFFFRKLQSHTGLQFYKSFKCFFR